MDTKVVVIGGGPAAVQAALTASMFSSDVTIISQHVIGDWAKLGVSGIIIDEINKPLPNWDRTVSDLDAKLHHWTNSMEANISEKHIKSFIGEVEFRSSHELWFKPATDAAPFSVSFDKLFIAVGSSPVFANGLEPDGIRIFSPAHMSSLKQLPQDIIVIGNGPIGFEYANIFNQYGVNTTWLAPEQGPFTPFDSLIASYLTKRYIDQGIHIVNGPVVQHIEQIENKVNVHRQDGTVFEADMAFVSIGFVSNLLKLNLEVLQLVVEQNGMLQLDPFGQTSLNHIYVVGDARYASSATLSMRQGRAAVLHAFGEHVAVPNYETTPIIFNQHPQVAQVGMPHVVASDDIQSAVFDLHFKSFKTFISSQDEGVIKLYWKKDGTIVGATVIGDAAAEMITPLSLAIQMKAKVRDMANFFAPHPSVAEVAFVICREIDHIMRQNAAK
ncbi:FAD-dependent oxidoreductase [Paenibacillus sp. 481]|uniref:FAD-dependent oxidoreductase n=1 Tax=Paenibacillus sp. 481 TaxID=2835869 RepID=UPI001E4B7BDA|nr:NAD(P)/FAD-dependent oxidoreductase [Paenibacillus sp. 481]UHA71785.1 NAD(P)/FAD-dependent oxidoreductase [Paenibacillus sp. 481]